MEQAIEYCIRNNILRDFLTEQKAEVVKMSIFEYDEQREIELIRRDEREIGKEIGERIGIEKERQNTEKERENAIKSVISLCREFGGDQLVATEKIMEKFALSREQAEKKVSSYWNGDIG